MSELGSIAAGLGLAAACGLRVFVPLLVLGAAARAGWVELGAGFGWIAGTPALIAFGVATVLEIAAYSVPWLDNLLDSLAMPAAVAAGVLATASLVTEMDPLVGWTVAIIAGGGLAGAVQGATTGGRAASSVLTGGLGNPLLAAAEGTGSLVLALAAVLVPVLALVAAIAFLAAILSWRRRRLATKA